MAYVDDSVETAPRDGGITKLKHVDVKVKNIPRVYALHTIMVTGE
ncbi:MAG: hypothetical protein H6683_04525 [Deltaproteobacteria bacterium]|nr:hypothetical protein [Deltaproteobacteria bacterium]